MERRRKGYLNYNNFESGGYAGYSGYNRTANAYSYARPVKRPYEEEERPGHSIRRKKIVKRKKAVVYKKLIDRSVRITKEFVIYTTIFFTGAMSLIMLNAMVVNKRNGVEVLRKEITALKEANQDMRIELAASYDENEIAQRAAMLNMGRPKPYQIIYINVPKESYASAAGKAAKQDEEGSLIDRIIGFILKD